MARITDGIVTSQRTLRTFVVACVGLVLLGLPIAVWLDLRSLTARMLRREAEETSRIIDDVRDYYGREVLGRLVGGDQTSPLPHNARTLADALPIPATLSIELGRLISARDGTIKYRFISDLPFNGRASHHLDEFERLALESLRRSPQIPVVEVSGSIFDRQVRAASAVTMGASCVTCHNAHPDSPKQDWKLGDVRGMQEISVRQPIEANIFAFQYLLLYFAFAAVAGVSFIVIQHRQATLISGINRGLSTANDFLATVAAKLAKYLSPQIYASIFSGEKDVTITTERKKLTIFFSDLKDFTATTERLQPEDLTALLNEYLTEMSAIALKHGATVNKFIGDAILAFFGDPETRGVEEDARSCLRMAMEMQQRMGELNARWRERGIERPLQVRIGINTGYCNVGNFGSNDRMDYTIIGSEANLAARLESIAEPGGIVISYETYALVRDVVQARSLPPISLKGIQREVVPYAVADIAEQSGSPPPIIREKTTGLEVFVDVQALVGADLGRARPLSKPRLPSSRPSRSLTPPGSSVVHHMSRATRASSDMRLWSQGGSKTMLTLTSFTPGTEATAFSTQTGISPATGQPGAVRVMSTATLRSSSTSTR